MFPPLKATEAAMNANDLILPRGMTPVQRAMELARRECELYEREQREMSKGEDEQAPWRELMVLVGRAAPPRRG